MADFNQQIITEFRENGGHVSTMGFGDRLVILHTTGARSGQPRLSPLMAIPTDGGWFVAASKGGAPDEPAWAHNLRAQPAISVEAPDGTVSATADELRGGERDAAWQLFLDASPGFAEYEKRTDRTIAVFRLNRAAA